MKHANFSGTIGRPFLILILFILIIFSCDRNNKHIISEDFFENGNVRYVEYYYDRDSSAVYAEMYYENGQLERVGGVNSMGYQTGLVKSYYSDGRLRDSCEYYNGYCIRSVFKDSPNKNNCYISLKDAEKNSRILLCDTVRLPKKDTIYFSTFIDGLPVDTYQMYIKMESDSVYSYVYGNNRSDYPYVIFTPNYHDTISLYFMFPNDSSQIIIGKTPQLKFNFIVE